MVPTKDRNTSGIYVESKGEGFLLDCGEGTQRQMNIAGIKRSKIKKIFISHWHGDHVSGIIGLIQTIGNSEEDPRLKIYGPEGTKEKMNHLLNSCIFDNRVDIEIFEVTPNEEEIVMVYEDEEHLIKSTKLDHGVPCVAYSIIEKERYNIDVTKQKKLGIKDGPHLRKIKEGETITYEGKTITPEMITYLVPEKKLSYVADTQVCAGAGLIAQNADILISESTFDSTLQEKAEEKKHLTSKDAAIIANNMNVKKLVLTHFSQRYKEVTELKEDAEKYFDDVVCAEDFMKIKI